MGNIDTDLTKKIARGDSAAFEEVYRRYHRQLYSMARSYLKDQKLAEDAVQDVFVRLWEKRDKLDARQSLKGYLFTMLRNQLLNTLRKRKQTIVSAFEIEEQQIPRQGSTDDQVIVKDYNEILHEGLLQLSDRKREIFELKYHGHTNDQIAKMLVISVYTVKTQYYHGLKFIRSYLRNNAEL